MKITLGQIFIAILITGLSYASTGKAQEVLNKHVTISITNSSLNNALKKIEKNADVKFVYSKSIIKTDNEVSITAREETLGQVLDKLLTKNGIAYEVVNERIVLTNIKSKVKTGLSEDTEETALKAFPVTGKVVDENGVALPGVSIMLENTNQGTTTDINGVYSINVESETDVLVFSFLGYQTKRVTVGTNSTLNVQLQPSDATNLQEVVVQGYGTITKSDLSSSIGSVKGETLRERPTSINVAQSLQGRIPGVNVMINSGKPGGAPAVKIRGVGSINTSSDPLWVVDGFVGANPINLDPNIIESIDVLKDAAATAIYGSRGSNGVIIVTTRRGKAGTSEVMVNNTLSFSSIGRRINLLDANERLQVWEKQYDYYGYTGAPRFAPHLPGGVDFARKDDLFNADGSPKYNTDWVEESTRLAVSNNHSLSFTGGTDKLSVTANLNYRNNEGILLNSYDKRISGFINLNWKIKPWLDVQATLNTGANQGNNVDLDPLSSTAIRKMYEMLPFLPVRYPDGSYSRQGDYPGAEDSENPVKLLNEIKNTVGGSYSIANFIGTFHITKDLDFVTQLGGQTEGTYDFYYAGRDVLGVSQSVNGRARRRHQNLGSWTNENYFSYKHAFGKHNVNLTAGASWYYRRNTYTLTSATGFFDDAYEYNNIGAGSIIDIPQSFWGQSQTNSYYGRLNYNYDNRYLFSATFRADGASEVATVNTYGTFPSFSAGWNLHNESFYQGSNLADVISLFKIRGSWGVTGNALLPSYAKFGFVSTSAYPFLNTPTTVATVSSLENPNLAWEQAAQTNIGIDLGFANNRINITANYYNKINSDLLLFKQLPLETGYGNVYQNIGKIRNRGIEISFTSVNITGKDFNWSSTANFTMNRSKVLKLQGVPIFGTWAGWIAEGRPLNEFYGYVREGVWGTDEAAEAATYGRKPGDTKWQDTNGNGTKDIDDRVPLGNAMPKWEANLINNVSYKGFNFLLDLGGMYGLSLINTGKHLMQNSATSVNSFADILNSWTPDNQNTNIPAVRTSGDAGNPSEVADSYAVEDASFIRIRNIGLSYTSSSPLLEKILIKKLRLGINVENAFLWTKYSGFDPEYTSLTPTLDQGVDIYQYPKPRIVSFSLNASF